MKILNTILIAILVVLVGGLYFGNLNNDVINVGSVAPMGGYDYAQYTDEVATATTTQVMAGAGIFGSVIITEDAAGTIVFYDATSTAAVTDGASSLYTRVADFQAASTEGTYTIDANVTNGLVFALSLGGDNFDGDMTVTYRQGY